MRRELQWFSGIVRVHADVIMHDYFCVTLTGTELEMTTKLERMMDEARTREQSI